MTDLQLEYHHRAEFLPEDFSEMQLNPFGTKGFMFNAYPEFSRRKVFSTIPPGKTYNEWTDEDLDLLIRVIVIMVDPESPLAEEHDFEQRRKQSLICVKGHLNDKVLHEVHFQGRLFSQLVYHFFKIVNDIPYESWYSMKIAFHEFTRQIRRPIPDDADAGIINARAKIGPAMTEIERVLKEKQVALFRDKRLEKLVLEEAADQEVGGWAEEFAEEPDWKKLVNQGDGEA